MGAGRKGSAGKGVLAWGEVINPNPNPNPSSTSAPRSDRLRLGRTGGENMI